MSIILRPYQQQVSDGVFAHWQKPRVDNEPGPVNVLGVAPTGGGKTAIMSDIMKLVDGRTASIAHRQELVSQISLALAKNDIYHRVIAPQKVVQFCIKRHLKTTGKNFHHDKAPMICTGVRTLLSRADALHQTLQQTRVWNIDEAHHVCLDNSWGKATQLMPNAYGVGFTALPLRADRKPLGRINGGLFDYMVQGPTMRELIEQGYLCDYKLIAPTHSIDTSDIPISEATGDLNQDKLRKAAHKSRIVGDIVENYKKFANGKQAIAFVVDIEQANQLAVEFNNAGVKALAVSSKTGDDARLRAIERFEQKDVQVLVNVDLFGEGFDVPAVECVIMGRPTESLQLFLQQFGRALRLAEGKFYGIIIDHVGNYLRHGLPDARRMLSLEHDARGSPRGQRDPDVMPTRRCVNCLEVYEAVTRTCPHCGHYDEPEIRSGPEHVDGDLFEVDPAVLERMRNEVSRVQFGQALVPANISDPAVLGAIHKNFRNRQTALTELQDAINLWGGIETQVNDRTESQAYSVFYHKFGIDVVSAQLMKTADMVKLTETIRGDWI